MKFPVLTVVLAAALVPDASAHVVLTYPPARYPQYDYLDNYRTGGPCGVADDPDGQVTTLMAGSTFNVTYYLSYPHTGGIRANILNSTGHVIIALLGLQEPFVNSEDLTLEHHQIILPPDFVCERCVLQLARQAEDFGKFGWIDSEFRSCADIAIVDSTSAVCDNMTCSGHGTCVNGKCECDRLYTGTICQFKVECEDETDCNGRGSCMNFRSSFYPSKQCFCNSGWFGDNCAMSSTLTDATIDPDEYPFTMTLHPQLTMYARIDGNEIEVALEHNGTSYVGVGWKPMEGVVRECNSEIPRYEPEGSNTFWEFPLSFPHAEGADTFYNNLMGISESQYTPPEDLQGFGGWSGLHAMDCTDLVIGMARGEQFRVFDYFTRDRGKPWRDSFYNGVDSLTAAVGKEEDGFTYIKWRRMLTTGDSAADHNIEDTEMLLIWAFGQVSPNYHHRSLTNEEFTLEKNQRFFPVDELKYHGGLNRGKTTINFFDAAIESDGMVTKAAANTLRSSFVLLVASILLAVFVLRK